MAGHTARGSLALNGRPLQRVRQQAVAAQQRPSIILGHWHISGHREMEKKFKSVAEYIGSWKFLIKQDLQLLEHRIKAMFLDNLKQWVGTYL